MKTIYLDAETFYSQTYSLRRMTPIEYILDPQFEVIGWAVAEDEGDAFWLDAEQFASYLKSNDLTECKVVTHNALFDCSILSYRYGVVPKLMIDTLGMARAKCAYNTTSLSLSSLANHFGIGTKGDAILKVQGMNAVAIKEAGLYQQLASYALNDVELCRSIYKKLTPFPVSEFVIQDMVLRCAVQPSFHLDSNLLAEHLHEVRQAKEQLLYRAGLTSRDDLMSNEKFAQALRVMGVEPPMKTSLVTGKVTYAFSKTDPAFLELEEHENPDVQALVAARLGLKSTLEESRTEKFLAIANLVWPSGDRALMPIPLRYSGAHTHRLSGDWGINMQNLPRGGKLRSALRSPEGHVVLAADAAQIEARMVAWFAGEQKLVDQFAAGEDVYSSFASAVFNRPVTKADKKERFIGKTCLAEGTLVVTDHGLVPIEKVTAWHRLWDGEEWVCHKGLVFNGYKKTLSLCGISLTPDHLVLCGTQWKEAQSLVQDVSTLSQALATGAANWLSPDTSRVSAEGSKPSSFAATAVAPSTPWTPTTSKTSRVLAATLARSRRLWRSAIGATRRPCRMMGTALDYLTASPQQSLAVTALRAGFGSITAGVASASTRNGEMIVRHSCAMSRPSPAGTGPISRWIVSTWMAITNRVTFGLSVGLRTDATSERSPTSKPASANSKPVYDLADAGPRHRFTVMTEAGPLIVHNCILGLGYGMGWMKFQATVKIQSKNQLGEEIVLSDDEAQRIVTLYRTTYPKIPAMWQALNNALNHVATRDHELKLGPVTCGVIARKQRVDLPSGLSLYYHNLRQEDGQWVFDYGRVKGKKIFGGKLLENIVQALARIVVMDAAVRLRKPLKLLDVQLAGQVHDELIYSVPEDIAHVVKQRVLGEMSTAPKWAVGLPLSAEADIGPSYGDAK